MCPQALKPRCCRSMRPWCGCRRPRRNGPRRISSSMRCWLAWGSRGGAMGKPNQQVVEPEAKLTELGELPSDWEIKKVGDVFNIQQGKALNRKNDEGLSPRPFL